MENTDLGEELVFNGVNGATGGYSTPPLPATLVAKLALGEAIDPRELAEARARYDATTKKYFGVVEGVDSANLAEAGWGVVFAHDTDPAIRDALAPLLERRREQASAQAQNRYREFGDNDVTGDHTVHPGHPVHPGQTQRSWLA